MSKVKEFMDRKPKALHRMRRYETKHKKNTRRKKIRNNEYGGFYGNRGWCGYHLCGGECYIDYDGEVYNDCRYDETRLIKSSKSMSYLCEDGEVRKIVGIREHTVKKINHGNSKNYHRHHASRRLRRKQINDESVVLKGNNYKKEYDIRWIID